MTAVIVLSVLGACLELTGLWLAAQGVRADVSAGREIQTRQPQTDFGTRVEVDLGMAWDVKGRTPTTEERVDRLEQQLRAVSAREREERGEMLSYVNQKLTHVHVESISRHVDLKSALGGSLTRGSRKRIFGLGLFALGALCAASASILSAVPS